MYDLDSESVKKIKIDPIKVLRVWHEEYKILEDWIDKMFNERKFQDEIPLEVYQAIEYYKEKVLYKKINHIEEMMLICQEIEEE